MEENMSRGWIIAFASSKGGPGKTTCAICLGTELALAGHKVALIDADPNQHLQAWGSLGAHERVDVVGGVTEESILERIREAAAGSDFVLVDLEGTANNALTYAVSKADLVIVPAQPSRMDLQEAYRAAALVERAGEVVERAIPYRILLSKMPVLATRAAKHAREQLVQSGIPVFDTEILERTAFREMSFHGQSPSEVAPDSNAALNVRAFADEVIGCLRAAGGTRRAA
jgi:chromosome partitioning protein